MSKLASICNCILRSESIYGNLSVSLIFTCFQFVSYNEIQNGCQIKLLHSFPTFEYIKTNFSENSHLMNVPEVFEICPRMPYAFNMGSTKEKASRNLCFQYGLH